MKRDVKIAEIPIYVNNSSLKTYFIRDLPKYAHIWDVLSWEGNRTT